MIDLIRVLAWPVACVAMFGLALWFLRRMEHVFQGMLNARLKLMTQHSLEAKEYAEQARELAKKAHELSARLEQALTRTEAQVSELQDHLERVDNRTAPVDKGRVPAIKFGP